MPGEPNESLIRVDGQAHRVSAPTMSGAQIKALAQKDALYQLFMEVTGTEADHLIPDHEAIVVSDGLQFYTIPPATAG